MSSEHQSDSEDADESQQRPDNTASDKEGDPDDIDDSEEEEDDMARRVSPSAPGSSRQEQPEQSARSPAAEEREPGCMHESVGGSGSGGSAGSSSSGGTDVMSLFSWLQNRTIRRGVFVDPARDNFRTMTSLYCSMNPAAESVNLSTQTHGAVFNLEYSPDG